jgi:Transposase
MHIEAWQRSGLSQRRYCRTQRLTDTTFTRWPRAIADGEVAKIRAQNARILAETEHEERRRRRKGRRFKLSEDKRNQAVQAFWAMHVETLNWSGMTVRQYAAATKLSKHSLRRWRDLIDSGEVAIDWRARLHPSGRPRISSGVSSTAKDLSVETELTGPTTAGPQYDRRSNRRSFSDEQKLAIVMESEAPGVSVAAVCRRHDISTSMVFRWRTQFGSGAEQPARLVSVAVAGTEKTGGAGVNRGALVLQDLLPVPDGMTAVDLSDGRRVFAPEGTDPEAVRVHVAERETKR